MVPPVLQSLGGEGCGPKTSKVTVPDGDAAPDSAADIEDAEIGAPAVSELGALTGPSDGETTVPAIPGPHPELVGWLLASPS